MSLKLNLRDKKRKKSLKTTKSRGDKLIYEIRRASFTREKNENIKAIHDKESKLWKRQSDDINGYFKLSNKQNPSNVIAHNIYPHLLHNPAADDSVKLTDQVFLSDTHSLELPIRIRSIFVICSTCKQPVCTATAGSILLLEQRYHYRHQACC